MRTPPLSAGRLTLVVAAALSLSACSALSPVPTWELVKATGAVTTVALSRAAVRAHHTVHFGDAPVTRVCIEFNRNAALADLVPSLQAALRAEGVASRVYEPGSGPDECTVWLHYAAVVEWGVPPLTDGYRAYLSAASMSLRRANGTLMASSAYDAGSGLVSSRWATTQHKLAPVVRALITGFES